MSEEFRISLSNNKYRRESMVREQLKARGIHDPAVLKAMAEIPREKFVPEQLKPFAYTDESLPIGARQTISQPYIVSLMVETLALTKESSVLEIGTGSGYNAAILSRIAGDVFTIEIIPTLHFEAIERFERMNLKNIHAKLSDGHRGWPEHAPYDGIVFTAAVPEVPKNIFDQLKLNAILVAPVGESGNQMLMKFRKTMNGKINKEEILPVRFVEILSMKDKSYYYKD